MATLFLGQNDFLTLIDGNAKSIWVHPAVKPLVFPARPVQALTKRLKRVEFSDVLSNYTLSLGGNILTVNIYGALAAKIAIQADGTKMVFKEGSADMLLTGPGVWVP